jgi:hypothetical protein
MFFEPSAESKQTDTETLSSVVDLDHGNLNYTVVLGAVLGNYEAEKLNNQIQI